MKFVEEFGGFGRVFGVLMDFCSVGYGGVVRASGVFGF